MNIIGKLKSLVHPSSVPREIVPVKATISRRTFFSFFGTGVVMLAKPDLFLGGANRFGVPAGQGNMLLSPLLAPGVRKEFAAVYAKIYRENLDNLSFRMLMDSCSNIPANKTSDEEIESLYAYYLGEVKKDNSWNLNLGPST